MIKRMGRGLMMITGLRFALNSNGIVVVNSKETIITGLRLAALLWRWSCEHYWTGISEAVIALG